MKDPKSSRIGLEWFAGKRRDGFDLARKCAGGQAKDVVNQPLTFVGLNTVKIALGATEEPNRFRYFACHADNPSE